MGADKNQDLRAVFKAAVLLRLVKEIEKILQGLRAAQNNTEKYLKTF